MDLLEYARVPATRVIGFVLGLRVSFAPIDAKPRRKAELVVGLVLVQKMKVLVVSNQPLER
jgi:hypothetical protein